METAHTCLQLIAPDKIADALGLCRALLKNYLLFRLMCRGHKYIRIQDKSILKEGEFRKFLAEKQAELVEAQKNGTAIYLTVKKYPRMQRRVMYVFEGSRRSPGQTWSCRCTTSCSRTSVPR